MLSRLLRSLCDTSNGLEGLEDRSLLSADYALSVGTLRTGLDRYLQPTINMPVTVVNLNWGPLTGGGHIDYYLSTDRTLDESDFQFTSTDLPAVRRIGHPSTTTLSTIRPSPIAPSVGHALAAGDYFVIAKLVTNQDGADSNPSNDVAASTTTLHVSYQTGNVTNPSNSGTNTGNAGGTQSNTPTTVTLTNGTSVTLDLRGPGTGQVVNVDGRIVVVVQGTTTQSELRIIPRGRGDATLGGLTINGSLKFLQADHVNINGNITIQGAIGNIVLGDVSNSTFNINGFGFDVGIQLGRVSNTSLTSNIPMRGLTVDRWLDTDSTPDRITAAYIEQIWSSDNFEAGVRVSGTHDGFGIRKIQSGGHLAGTWSVAGNIDVIQVRSLAHEWHANISGEANSILVRDSAGGSMGVAGVRRFIVGGNVSDATYIAGANLGSNGILDGTSGGDSFSDGRWGVIEIRGSMTNSLIAAGYATTDNIIGNSDDALSGNSGIDSITVNRDTTDSHFAAKNLPRTARMRFRNVSTSGNSTFISS